MPRGRPRSGRRMAAVERELTLVDKVTGVLTKIITGFEKLDDKVDETAENAEKKAEKASGGILKKLTKFAGKAISIFSSVFGALKNFLRGGIEYVPDDIIKPFYKIKDFFEKTLGRVVTSFFKGAQKGFEKFQKALDSPAVRKAIIFLQVAFEAIGAAVGFVAERVAAFMQFLGEQLTNAGIDFAEVFEFIGGLFGALYVTAHNIVATLWNAIATFAEFFANVFKDPVHIVQRLFVAVGRTVLDVVMFITRAIDKIFKKDWTAEIQGLQDKLIAWGEEQYGDSGVKFDRMETISYDDVTKFAEAGRSFGERLSSANFEKEQLASIKNIESGVGGIYDAVTDEDLQMLIDIATQKFVSNVNLTAQTPVITINGANTGSTDADRRALANTIRDILVEQVASGSTSGQYAYAGA